MCRSFIGKYIFSLDNDDMYFIDDLFRSIYYLSESGKYDIVEYHSVYTTKYDAKPTIKEMKDGGFYVHRHNLSLHQPELGLFPIKRFGSFKRNDFIIWTKCIKTKIYQKSINAMGEERYSKYMANTVFP